VSSAAVSRRRRPSAPQAQSRFRSDAGELGTRTNGCPGARPSCFDTPPWSRTRQEATPHFGLSTRCFPASRAHAHHADGRRWSPALRPAGRRSDQGRGDVLRRTYRQGLTSRGTSDSWSCARAAGRSSGEIGRQTYVPLARLGQSPSTPGIAAQPDESSLAAGAARWGPPALFANWTLNQWEHGWPRAVGSQPRGVRSRPPASRGPTPARGVDRVTPAAASRGDCSAARGSRREE
jgi:hypothetical protein